MMILNDKSSTPCIVFMGEGTKRYGKRRIASDKECEKDLKEYLTQLFDAVNEGIDKYDIIRTVFKPEAKTRGYDAGTLNTAIVECIQKTFPNRWKWGKYKRFILNLPGYLFLVKKLDDKGFPMNIMTKHSQNIANQAQLSLFTDEEMVYEPIIYIGYQVTKTGEVINPKLVYIDEGKIKWELTKNDIVISKTVNLNFEKEEEKVLVTLKKQQDNNAKKAN